MEVRPDSEFFNNDDDEFIRFRSNAMDFVSNVLKNFVLSKNSDSSDQNAIIIRNVDVSRAEEVHNKENLQLDKNDIGSNLPSPRSVLKSVLRDLDPCYVSSPKVNVILDEDVVEVEDPVPEENNSQSSPMVEERNVSNLILINPEPEVKAMTDTNAKTLEEENAELKQRLKMLKQQLQEKEAMKNTINNADKMQDSSTELQSLRAQIMKLNNDTENYTRIMEEFDKTITAQVADLKKVRDENEIANRHLATLETAFTDLLQKYERCKSVIEGYKVNEETLRQNLTLYEEILHKNEEKYEALKAHAKAQLEKSSKEFVATREAYEAEITKLNTIVKRLDIKNESVMVALDQKIKECTSMAALLDEMTGKV